MSVNWGEIVSPHTGLKHQLEISLGPLLGMCACSVVRWAWELEVTVLCMPDLGCKLRVVVRL